MGDVSRRAVLGAGAGLIGLVVLGVDEPDASAATPRLPRRSDYSRSVRGVFTATHGKRTYKVRLTRIHDVAGTRAKQRESSFNLVFTPVGRTRLPDGIYAVRRRGVRPHTLFLSGVGTNGAMQALVNRSR